MSIAWGHRGWNGHPLGSAYRDGAVPGIPSQIAAFAVLALERGQAVDEHLSVGMFRLPKQLSKRASLHELSGVHHAERIDELGHEADVVARSTGLRRRVLPAVRRGSP